MTCSQIYQTYIGYFCYKMLLHKKFFKEINSEVKFEGTVEHTNNAAQALNVGFQSSELLLKKILLGNLVYNV